MKILYVEDELCRDLEKRVKLFHPFLNDKTIQDLDDLIDERHCSNANVKEHFEKSGIMKVCYTFPEAVNVITNHLNDYDLYIIDRNLAEANDEYEVEDIPNYSDSTMGKYYTREGDYLLSLIKEKDLNWSDKFYFLTANANDKLKCEEVFKEELERNKFKIENILDKSQDENIAFSTQIVNNFQKGNYRVKFKEVFEVFRKGLLSKEVEANFILTLENMNSDKEPEIRDNLAKCRIVLEVVCSNWVKLLDDEELKKDFLYIDSNGKGQVKMSTVINFLAKSTDLKKLDLIYKFSNCIYNTASTFGAHISETKDGYLPTKYSVQAATYALCDILLWYKNLAS